MQRSAGSIFFSAGDIAAGEAIVYYYGDFSISSGWAEFGL